MTYLDTAIEIIKKIESEGYEAYIVGGFVRDYILNIPSNDIDITTSALPDQLKNIFKKVVPTGIKFEGVTIIENGYTFEVTTFRKDISYYDHRHPNIAYASTLAEDLSRRDFTINAMAIDKDFNIIDMYNGKRDLENKVLRAVGKPSLRFNEDALRILRGYYFASKLNFEIDPETISGMDLNAEYLNFVSGERVTRELDKLFKQEHQHKGIFYLVASKAIDYLPSLKQALFKVYNIDHNISFIELLCLGFYLEGPTNRYSLTRAESRQINTVINLIDKDIDNLDLFNTRDEDLLIANDIKKILNMNYSKDILLDKSKLVIKNVKELDIKPKDIIALGYKDNEISIKFNEALKSVLDKKVLNKKDEILNELNKKVV